jgi:hypothetical protein
MRGNRWAYVAIVAGLSVAMLVLSNRQGTGQAHADKPAVVWEYKTLYWGGGDPTPSLNELGLQRWELIASRGYGNEIQSQTLYVFKRTKP